MIFSTTCIATPPDATLEELFEDHGISEFDFAEALGITFDGMRDLIAGTLRIGEDPANRLEKNTGPSASFWLKTEAGYREKLRLIQEERLAEKRKEAQSAVPAL